MLRWHLQQGRQAIPKSVKPARIAENFDVFDFGLSRRRARAIDALDTGARGDEGGAITCESWAGSPGPEEHRDIAPTSPQDARRCPR